MMCLGGAESEDGPGFLEKESHKQRHGRVRAVSLSDSEPVASLIVVGMSGS